VVNKSNHPIQNPSISHAHPQSGDSINYYLAAPYSAFILNLLDIDKTLILLQTTFIFV
jgi:hypothetical protein